MKLNPDCIRDILIWLEENQMMERGYLEDNTLTGRVAVIYSSEIPQHIQDYTDGA